VTLGTGDQLVICEDITKQTQLEAQLRHAQKMEAIGTLTAGITHDFNNLLQVIQGYSELLLFDKTESDDDYGNLSEILRVTKMGGELTKKLLTFGRGIESKLRPVDLNYEIMQLQSLLKRTISKMIEFELCLAENLSPVNADTSQLEQIIMNLAINARDAMPQGGRLIIETKNVALDEDYWSTHPETKPGKYVVIAVSDTGCGMDEETLQHIFEPFFTTKKVGEGTGLGMAVVYGIVKSHAGHITCHSEPGVGTTFKIYLPAIEQVLKHPDPDAGYELYLQGTETILLVDDEENIIRLAEQGLSCFGYSVIAATNGEVALELYRGKNSQIDLIVLDLIMPGMGGLKCLEELLKINPQAKIVIASGCAVDGMPKCVLEAGAKTFIPKPFRLEEMAKEIRNVLDQK
jgi:nitrogen-specific signal transduction histidine kinase/CheY-like chemotaxis protein